MIHERGAVVSLKIRIKETLAKLFIILFAVSRLVFYNGASWNGSYGFYSMAPTVGSIDQILLALSNAVGILFSFCCFKDYLKRCNRYKAEVGIIGATLILFISMYWIADFLTHNSFTLLWVGNFTPLTLLFGNVLFSGYDDDLMRSISYFSKYVAIVFLGLSLIHTIQFYIEYGGVGVRYGNSNIMSYFIYGFYALTLFVCGNKEFGYCKNNTIIFTLIFLAFLLSVASVSRGWIIQTLALLLYAYLGKDVSGNKYQNKFMSRLIAILIIIGIVILIIIQFAPNIVITLAGRLNQDTRSLQISEFMSQMTVGKIFTGQGYNATYMESAHGNYSYIDNQFLMMIFRYGLIPLFLYAIILLKSCWGFIKYRIGYGFSSLMWLAALNGLAIYLGFGIDIPNMLMMFVISRSLAIQDWNSQEKLVQIKNMEDQNE